MSEKIRDTVHVVKNSHGGTYEALEDPELWIINIAQTECWVEDGVMKSLVKSVPMEVDCQLYKEGFRLPGNIISVWQTDPPTEDETNMLLLDKHGEPVLTNKGRYIYHWYWYDPHSNHQPYGELVEESKETLQDIINSLSK